jgi:hypothetical protein
MGNITTKSVGDFQANVGIFSADIGVIISYVTAGILILIAIGLAITAFVPMKPWDCGDLNDLKQTMLNECPSPQLPQVCNNAKDNYNKEEKRCNTKVKQTWLLWFLLLIPLAILIVIFSKWWDNFVHKNKTAAQVGGTLFELNTLKNFMRN